ncbi:hypothetical protein [Chitinophaga sp.]|uniref:hypothetical protein n=1 Tax=Chitinophaga sp. TaxID=1869181 RepID=UPI0031CF9EFD
MRTILSLDEFSLDEIGYFAQAIKKDQFSFMIAAPSEMTCPKDIHAHQLTHPYYAGMLDDPAGHFQCFLICFDGGGEQLRFPMGIFGVSPANKIRFPILLSGRILNFLNIDEDTFAKYVYSELPPEEERSAKWRRFYGIKKHLIRRILQFYTQLDDEFIAAMAWKARGPNSMTRQVGEALPAYIRTEDQTGDTEYYYKNTLSDQLVQYLHECYARRDHVTVNTGDAGSKPAVYEISWQLKQLLSSFIAALVGAPRSFS